MSNTQMTTKQKETFRNLFTEEQWDMIYNFVGNALDDDAELFNPEDVYAIRNKIHALFNWNSMTWFIQIQDKDSNVLLLNQELGNYQKYTKRIDNKASQIVAQFPNAHRWEVRPNPYTHKAILWCSQFATLLLINNNGELKAFLHLMKHKGWYNSISLVEVLPN